MSPLKISGSFFLAIAIGSLCASNAAAQLSSMPDFSGVWQINDAQSDSVHDVNKRYHVERRREQAPTSQPGNAYPAAASTSSNASSSGHGGHHGGGMGGMGGGSGGGGFGGGGGGHGGGHNHSDSSSSSDSDKPAPDPVPPLLTDDGLLNVQQRSADVQVDYNNNDRLETKFDGVTRQSLNGTAHVQTSLSSNGMHVSMQFGDGTHLEQDWVKSADGKHLTVTQTWTPVDLQQPVVFKRVYDQLGQ